MDKIHIYMETETESEYWNQRIPKIYTITLKLSQRKNCKRIKSNKLKLASKKKKKKKKDIHTETE